MLLGPPTLEFAPYAKIPGGRVRKDARQGTIDQDPDFIAFLESLTQPITKPTVENATDGEEKKESITTTPLVQYIREKKANKAKDAAAAKAAKQAKDKESKSEKGQAKKLLQRPDKDAQSGDKGGDKKKADKASKEAVKAANKQAATVKQAAKTTPAQKDTPTGPAAERKRERGNVAAAAKILQRDLGLAPAAARRKAAKAVSTDTESPKEETEPKKETSKAKGRGKGGTPQPSETTSRAASESGTPPAGTPPAGKSTKPAKGKQGPTNVTPAATQAFLKHANPSQGVTETLLETTFTPFGNILKVEIDRKKGFGYIDFAEPDGLQKAIAASPVSVAESQVVVLERKQNPGAEKSRKPPANGRNGKPADRGRGRGRREGNAKGGGNGNGAQGEKAGEKPEAK